MDKQVNKHQITTVCDKHHEGSKQGTAMANNTVEGASLDKVGQEVLTEYLASKPRPEGQVSSHMKSQEKNILRREKVQESGESFHFSRNNQKSIGEVELREQSRECRT